MSLQQYLRPQKPAGSGTSFAVRELRKQHDTITSSHDSHSTDTSNGSQIADLLPVKVRGGVVRRPAGYQVCIFNIKLILI